MTECPACARDIERHPAWCRCGWKAEKKKNAGPPGDTRAYDAALSVGDSMEVIERRWLEVWAPRFGLDPKLKGRERALAMAKATGLMHAIPKATQRAMREPGQDDEEVSA